MTTADDVRTAVSLAAATLRTAVGRDWHVPADGLTWSCWETVEHIADDIFTYAAQVASENAAGQPWAPPEELCDRALRRLFREAPTTTGRWPTLLWATGRGDLPGHPRRTDWKWDGTPA